DGVAVPSGKSRAAAERARDEGPLGEDFVVGSSLVGACGLTLRGTTKNAHVITIGRIARADGAFMFLPPPQECGLGFYRIPELTRVSRNNSPGDNTEKPNVIPKVNSQSGTLPVNPRRTPASSQTFLDDHGCQITPRSPEVWTSSRRGFSPLTSPTSRTPLATGSSPIRPQIPTRSPVDRSTPRPALR